MVSFVHFKFKSQKEPQRVSFDAPFISVWDLKREIIKVARLGDGTDFDLKIYNENTNEEYIEDTELISKDSTVLARRLPAAIPGKGRAARYVSGKPPVSAKVTTTASSSRPSKVIDMESLQTEEERVKAMFNLNNAQWQQKQEEMAHEARVPLSGSKPFQKKSNVPEGEPPHGYICYRCGKKGHWIQACPTNDDANYDNKNRIKRTTGIPRSMLKKIDQSEIDNLDQSQRQNLMVNADGEYVFAQADEKEWRKHLERVKAAEAAQKKVQLGDKELQERGLECSIDKRLFVDPMKTPCCGKTYCHDCIENALLENDLTCPGCETENVSLERLEPDEDMKTKIKAFEAEKSASRRKSISPAASPKSPEASTPVGGSPRLSRSDSKSPVLSDAGVRSKKRTSDEVSGDKSTALAAPAMKRQKSTEQAATADDQKTDTKPATLANSNLTNPIPASMMPPDMSTLMQNMQNMPPMNFPMPVPTMPMPIPGMPFMPMPGMMDPGMMNPGMMMPGFMPPNFNMMNGMFPPNFSNPMMNGGNFNQANNMFSNQSMNMNMNSNPMPNLNPNPSPSPNPGHSFPNNNSSSNANTNTNNTNNMKGIPGAPTGPRSQNFAPPTGPANHKFSNQQRHVGKEEDNAYMRQPVNPHRHQNRPKRARQADYREL